MVSRRPSWRGGFQQSSACPALALALFLVPASASAQNEALSRRKIAAVALASPPTIDGDLSDAVWASAAKADRFSDRTTQRTDIDQTEAWIGYDDAALYLAFHCHDSEPDRIVAREIRPDSGGGDEDVVRVALDPFHTRRGADTSYFSTNALGTRSGYLAGGRAPKLEWKGEWAAAAKRVPDGWTAEMRIPWRILNVPIRSTPVTFGLNFVRVQQRTKIVSEWSNRGLQGFDELSGDWEGVRVPRGAFERTISLLPYTTTGAGLGGNARIPFGFGRGQTLNAGIDARSALTPELTAVATLNPDFSTVERAVAGIEFNRGERFVPDTRPFFLDGGNIFRVNESAGRAWGSAFFSGRVPAFDAGGKLYGRYGARDSVGVLATAAVGDRRFDMVGRWLHDVGPSSTVGAYLVQRALPGDSNIVVGVNEFIRKGPWLFRSDLAQSLGDDASGSAVSTGVRWDHGYVNLHLAYTRVAKDFKAANGFVPFTDFHGPDASVSYYREWRKGPVRDGWLYCLVNNHWRTDGDFFRRLYELNFGLDTRSDWGVRWGWNGGRFQDERDSEYRIGLTRNVSNRYNRVGVDYRFGTRANRPIRFIEPNFSKRLPGKWDLAVSSSLLSHTEDHSLHVITLAREIDPYRAVGGRVTMIDGVLHYFLTYRVSGGRGVEMFFLLGDPVANGKRTRTRFLTKFVFPLEVK